MFRGKIPDACVFPPPIHPSVRQGFVPRGHRDNQILDRQDEQKFISHISSQPRREDTTHLTRPCGGCPWEQTVSAGLWEAVFIVPIG